MKPQRIQRQRAKGWKMPPNTVYVGRPTKWGNPFVVGQVAVMGVRWDEVTAERHGNVTAYFVGDHVGIPLVPLPDGPLTIEKVISRYRAHILESVGAPKIRAELRGKNLCCYCRLDQPCHADVLLELANA